MDVFRRRGLLAWGVATFASACHGPSSDDTNAVGEPALPGIEFDADGVPIAIPATFSLDYGRSGCLGPCPVYALQVTGDGSGEYSGSYCVEDAGPHDLAVTAGVLSDFVKRLGALRFFELQARYDEAIKTLDHTSDVVTVTMRVTSGGKTASVVDDGGYEGNLPSWMTDLRDLEAAIPDAAGVDIWVGNVPWGDTDAGVSCAQP